MYMLLVCVVNVGALHLFLPRIWCVASCLRCSCLLVASGVAVNIVLRYFEPHGPVSLLPRCLAQAVAMPLEGERSSGRGGVSRHRGATLLPGSSGLGGPLYLQSEPTVPRMGSHRAPFVSLSTDLGSIRRGGPRGPSRRLQGLAGHQPPRVGGLPVLHQHNCEPTIGCRTLFL